MDNEEKRKKGFLVGKFAPLHKGHEYFIRQALEYCDELCVILSHDERFLDSIPQEIRDSFSPERRFSNLVELLSKLDREFRNKRTLPLMVDESNIPQYPNGWPEFVELCLSEMKAKDYVPNMVFSSETSYDVYYKQYLPQCEHVIIDSERSQFPISGTEIRELLLDVQHKVDKMSSVMDRHILNSLVLRMTILHY